MYRIRVQLHEQVAAAFALTDWTVEELLARSKLPMDRTQLGRKLNGKAPMRTEEAQVLIDTIRKAGFNVILRWPSPKKSKRAA